MVKCFNKGFVNDAFVNTIMTQPLWENKFITSLARAKKNVLFLRNWGRSGIRTVRDRVFRNGILDEHHVCQTDIQTKYVYRNSLSRRSFTPMQTVLAKRKHISSKWSH